MPDEIKQRLQDCADQCMKAYEGWRGDEKNGDKRETLQETIHDLRRVASRLEIELALNERSNMTQKPMPIPSHRAAKGRSYDSEDVDGNGNGAKPDASKKSKPVKLPPKKNAEDAPKEEAAKKDGEAA